MSLLLDIEHVRLLVSASPNQPANSVFLSQKTSTSQSKPAPTPTSEQAHYLCPKDTHLYSLHKISTVWFNLALPKSNFSNFDRVFQESIIASTISVLQRVMSWFCPKSKYLMFHQTFMTPNNFTMKLCFMINLMIFVW